MRPLLRALLVMATYGAGFAAFTWPLVTVFPTEYLHEGGDGWVNTWNLWWVSKATLELGSNPWWSDWLFHPEGVTLIGQSLCPLNGLLALPLLPLLGPVATYNTLVVLGFVLGGWCTWLLAWHLTRHAGASLFAGAAVTFSHYHFAHLVGHLPQVTLQCLPLFLWTWIRMLEAPTPARGLWAGGALVLNLLTDLYFVLYCAIFGVVLFGREVVRRRVPWFWLHGQALRALLAFGAVTLPTVGLFTAAFASANATDPLMHAHDPYEFSSDLLDMFVPGCAWQFAPWTEWHWQSRPRCTLEFDTYVGWSVLLLAVLGVRRAKGRPRLVWLFLAVLSFAIALGPGLRVASHVWRDVPMPYDLLGLVFPPLRLAGSVSRTGIMTVVALAILAAYGIAALGPGGRRWLWLWVALFCFEVWPWQVRTSRLERDDVLAALARLPDGAVYEPHHDLATQMGRQTVHGRKLPLGYIARPPETRAARYAIFVQLLADERHAKLMRRYKVRYLVLRNELTGGTVPQELVALHRGPYEAIWVLPEDDLARRAVPPRITAVPHQQLDGFVLELHAPQDAGQRFVCAFSSARTPGIQLPGLGVVPLAVSELLSGSLLPGDPRFAGNHGRFDEQGRARVQVRLPPDSLLRAQPIYFGVLVVEEGAPLRLRAVDGFGSWWVR
jgi:hypothetical protein